MNILVDCTFFGHEEIKKNSIFLSTSIFTAEILNNFAQFGINQYFTLVVTYNHAQFFKQNFPQFKIITLSFFPLRLINTLSLGKIKATKYLKKWGFFKRAAEKGKFDAIWFPYCSDYTFVKTSLPSVCTVHDIFRVHKNGMKKWDFITRKNCEIVTVSDFTKDDIAKTFSLTDEQKNKIKKITNPISHVFTEQTELPFLKGKTYILNINAYTAKKNQLPLLKAFNIIKDKTDALLVLCGSYKEKTTFGAITEFIERNNLNERVILLYHIQQNELNYLLTHARLFISTSMYEGFGRTPVEAAINYIPVITTKETAIHEATMGLCTYMENPHDENELSRLILKELSTPQNFEKLQKISEQFIKNYSPQKISEEYTELFLRY